MSLKQTMLNVNYLIEGLREHWNQERNVLQLSSTTGDELQMFLAHAYICNPRGFFLNSCCCCHFPVNLHERCHCIRKLVEYASASASHQKGDCLNLHTQRSWE